MEAAENDSIRTKLGGDADRLGEYYCADCANLHVVQKKWPLFKKSLPMRPGILACQCSANQPIGQSSRERDSKLPSMGIRGRGSENAA